MKVSVVLVAAIVLTVACAPSMAHAQPGDRVDATRQAKVLFDQALEKLRQGRASQGRDLLRRSLALYPTIPTRYNLGLALGRTGETTEAIEIFEELLSGKHGDLSLRQKREITEQLEGARSELATLEIHVDGAEQADVHVDGNVVGVTEGSNPVNAVVDAGTHVVAASLGGLGSVRTTASVGRGERTEVKLRLEAGKLVVKANSPDDVIELVGVARRPGALNMELPASVYTLRVENASGQRERKVTVQAGQTVRLQMDSPRRRRVPKWVWITTAVVIAGAATATALLVRDKTNGPVDPDNIGIRETLRTF